MHAWHIEPREYERHEARRGRRHAYEHLDPAATALVVVDMVDFFLADNPYARGIVPNIRTLASHLRAAGGLVAWVVPSTTAPNPAQVEFFGESVATAYAASGGPGSPRDRVSVAFDVQDDDLVVEKTAASAFFPGRCDLPALLAERDVSTVLVTGTVANVCCESTARDAGTLGYRVIMVADANAAVRDADLNATLHTVYRSFGDVRSTAEIIGMIDAGPGGPVS
ncbi:MAG: cysteine hydrolase [Acidimicrobiaceae bacterium]|nr:cysteine hydrolase [Acidimicrobiaceae bacterium]MCO5331848.1 cysteine hydrolase [Ilumatobacteraceae bacterium]